jgi:hypothetical protein
VPEIVHHNALEVNMNTVKAIKDNPRCVASITVKVKGRNTIRENKPNKISNLKKTQINSC